MAALPMYRDSIAWEKAMTLSTSIYELTSCFPREEMFGLTNQLRRASVSIPSNIAEGKGRVSIGEFIQFLGMARGSVLEVQTQLDLALRLRYGNAKDIEQSQNLAMEVLRILNASLVSLKAKQAQRHTKV